MSAVDVLAVMQRSANVARCNSEAHPDSRLLRSYAEDAMEARDAVAELIAADEEYDAAKRDLFQPSEYSREKADRLCAANTRRDAALARVQGVQS